MHVRFRGSAAQMPIRHIAAAPARVRHRGERIRSMVTANDDELQALRQRAYGPNADIHLDQRAIQRLRELEDGIRAYEPVAPAESPVATAEGLEPHSRPVEQAVPIEHAPRRSVMEWLRPLWSVRRSNVLIVLGVIAVGAFFAVALIVVQRVQTDPLQVGAIQVARLSVDSAYNLPAFFVGANSTQDSKVEGFQEFHGLRTVFVPDPGNGDCLQVYPSTDITNPKANTFSGQLFQGCAAGAFPAIVQLKVDATGLPSDLRSAFPNSAALQFVYDRVHNEVVVFTDGDQPSASQSPRG
jgi:hypothetical protein